MHHQNFLLQKLHIYFQMLHIIFLPLLWFSLSLLSLFIFIFCPSYSFSTIPIHFLPFIFSDFLFHKHPKKNNQHAIHSCWPTIIWSIDASQDTKHSHECMTEDSQYLKLGGDDETCSHLGLENIKISNCMTILEIFPCYHGKCMPSVTISSYQALIIATHANMPIQLVFHSF